LKYRDFNNKYCYAVHAINDITKKSGFSPTTVRFLLTALVGSKAARGTTGDQITQALSTTNFRDLNAECNSLVDLALNEWAVLSTAGLGDVSVNDADGVRLCRFQSTLFVPKDNLAFKAEFNWLLTKRMGVDWIETSRKDFSHAEKLISKLSKGRFSHIFPKHSVNSLVLATTLQFKGQWVQNLALRGISKGTFEVSPIEKIDMPMLQVTTKVIYYKDSKKGFHLVGIPFKDTRFAIAFLLPLVPHKFVEVEKRFAKGLDYGLFVSPKLQIILMQVVIPVFRLQTEVDLCKALPFLGIKNPFDSERADFSGISDAEKMHIECGTESSFLQVSRSGVRLTAVASFGLTTEYSKYIHPDLFNVPDITSPTLAPQGKEVRSFIVNQPFSVFLVDRESECVLYQARVKVPEDVPVSSESPNNSN
uniref:SERPIN domain-containing protein n=2 Tax=Hymenolepis diminuta TaxID=6216 RepID=A0A0R3S9G4_HYMDI